MIAVLAGIGAAILWAVDTLCGSRTSKIIGAASVTVSVMLVGVVASLPAALAAGSAGIHNTDWLALTVAGVLTAIALVLSYAALGQGPVGIVAPILSTEGAIAAMVSVARGERLRPTSAFALGVIVVGVILITTARSTTPDTRLNAWQPICYAFLAAVIYGIALYIMGHVSSRVSLGWVMLIPRATALLVIGFPLIAFARLRLKSRALPLLAVSGVGQIGGVALFALGARTSVAVASVVASQFASIAAIGAVFFFHEAFTRHQIVGLILVGSGLALISAVPT